MCAACPFDWRSRLRIWLVSLLPCSGYAYFSYWLCSKPVADGVTSGFPTFELKINDTKPIWGYCGQTGHCQQGMVFGFNTPSYGPNTFAAFQQLALKSNATASSTAAASYSTSGSYSGGSKEHTIVVGPNGQLAYDPPYINANPGDTVKFTFRQKNHTGTVFSSRLLDGQADLPPYSHAIKLRESL
jgi:plastocyanin